MSVPFHARAAYLAQHRAMAIQGTLLNEAARAVMRGVGGRRYRMARMPGPLAETMRRRFEDLLARDLANVEAGHYPRELLFQMPLAAYTRRLPLLLGEMRRAASRARRGDHRLPDEVDADTLPAYYRRTFHWQPDGYLSKRSAEAYDVGVELVFRGTADLMRRQIIPPVSRWLRARGGGEAALVDLACGTGRTLRQLEVAHPGLATLGVDLSRPYLDVAARLTRARLVVANAEALPLPDASADVVTCVFLFHELPLDARRRVLAEARRVVRPGGLLVLEDSCQPSDSPELAPVLAQFPRDLHEPYYKSYLRHDLADLAREAGFAVDAVEAHLVSKVVVARPA